MQRLGKFVLLPLVALILAFSATPAAHATPAGSAHATHLMRPLQLGGQIGSETTTATPGLVSCNGRLVLAWEGQYNGWINFLTSTDGTTWGNKVTVSDTAFGGVSLACMSGTTYVAWTGTDSAHSVNVARFTGSGLTSKVTNGTSTDRPALTYDGADGNLYLAVSGTDYPNGHIWVKQSADGMNWSNYTALSWGASGNPPTRDGPGLQLFYGIDGWHMYVTWLVNGSTPWLGYYLPGNPNVQRFTSAIEGPFPRSGAQALQFWYQTNELYLIGGVTSPSYELVNTDTPDGVTLGNNPFPYRDSAYAPPAAAVFGNPAHFWVAHNSADGYYALYVDTWDV